MNVTNTRFNRKNFFHTFIKQCLCTEYTCVILDDVTDCISNFLCIFTRGRLVQFTYTSQSIDQYISWKWLVLITMMFGHIINNVLTRRFTKYHKVKQRVGTQTVRTMNRYARTFTDCIKTFYRFYIIT